MKLSIQQLSFAYRGHRVLEKIDLEIPSGSLCALLGANGAGKTTLLKCISGILRPFEGRILADDIDLLSLSARQRARLLGYVPQNAQAENSSLNVLETVLSGRVAHRMGKLRAEDRDMAIAVLDQFSLNSYAFRELGQLSGGERQRVFIARAVAQQPKILMLDEPTSNLDMRFQQETMELLRQMSTCQKMTVVTILHDLNMAIAYADRVALLKGGKIYRSGTPQQALGKQEIEEVFGVTATFAERDGVRYLVPGRASVQ